MDAARLLQEDTFSDLLKSLGKPELWQFRENIVSLREHQLLDPAGDEGLHNLVQLGIRVCREGAVCPDLVQQALVRSLDVLNEGSLKGSDLAGLNFVEESTDTAVDDGSLVLDRHWHVLALLQQLSQPDTPVQQLLGCGVKIGTELGEGSDLTVLGELKLHGTGDLLHGLGLGSGADTGHRETDVDGGSDTLVEQLSLQEDLSVSDGDDIGGDVGGHVTGLGLNDGQGGEGATSHGVGHLGGTLKQPGVEVEDITGVSLTAWGTPEQQRHLPVSDGLLGQVVEDDHSVHAVVTEVLSHGHAGVGGKVLQGGGVRGGGRDDNGVLHGVSVSEPLHNLGDGGPLLANGDVDTVQLLLGIIGLVESLLVDDGVNGDGGLASLPVSDDQLTLATANGHKGVNSLDASLHRLGHGLPGDDAGSLQANPEPLAGSKRTFAINGVAQGINDPAETLHADGDVDDGTSPLDNIALLDELVVTEDDNTNVVRLQVEGHALQARAELHHLLSLDVLQTIDTGNTVSNGEDTASLLQVGSRGGSKDPLLQDGRDLAEGSLGLLLGGGGAELPGSHGHGGSLLGHVGGLGGLPGEGRSHSC